MLVQLEVSDNKSKVKRITLKSDAVIGRSSDCSLKIASSQVSRQHCRIIVNEAEVRVKDLGSANGTFLNGELLPPEKDVPISSGAQISVGPVRFVVRFEIPKDSVIAPASTKEIPAIPEGKSPDEVFAETAPAEPAAEPKLGQVAGGAVAGAMAAAAKAEARTAASGDSDSESAVLPPLPKSKTKDATDDDTIDWVEESGRSSAASPPSPTEPPPPSEPAAAQPAAAPPQDEVPAAAAPEVVEGVVDVESDEDDEEYEYEYEYVDEDSESDDEEYEYEEEEYEAEEPVVPRPASQVPVVDEPAADEPAEEEPAPAPAAKKSQPKRGGLFGLFGRKRKADVVEEEDEEDEEDSEYEDEDEDFEEEVSDEEVSEEEISEDQHVEIEVEEAEPKPAAGGVSDDDVASFLSDAESDSPMPRGDEGDLGDFLRQFEKE